MTAPAGTLYTLGHSTRTWEEFLEVLRAHGIGHVADIRLIPGSRRHPQFGGEALARALEPAGIGYTHFPDLGGRRRPRPDSPNGGWRNPQFQGYADHMESEAFQAAFADLLALAAGAPTTVLCAEAVPWRCHRQLVADAALARGWAALDILDAKPAKPHKLTPFALVEPGPGRPRLSYPPVAPQLL